MRAHNGRAAGRREALTETALPEVPGLARLLLPNGLTVYVLRRSGVPLIGLRLLVPSGSAHCPDGQSGLAELTAQLLRRGTARHSAEQIDQLFESVGSDLGIGVGDDSTRFSLTAEPVAAPRLLALLAELLTSPAFPKPELAALRSRTCDQLKGALDDAEWVATRAAYLAAFGAHPYARPSEGWSREVAALGRKEVRAFAGHYVGRGACLVLSGAVGPELERLLQPLRALPAGPDQSPSLPEPAALRGRGVLIVDKPDASQAQLRLVGSGIRRDSAELVPLILGNGVLGDGFSSRLVNEVRVNRGLTYGISSRFGSLAAGGLFAVRSFTRLEKAGELVQVVLDQLAALRDGGPTEDELARVRTYLGGSFRLSTETPEQLGGHLADAYRYGLGESWLARYPQLLAETSREAVAGALQAHLPVERFRVVAVGPAALLEKQLKRFGPVEVLPLTALA